jgi:hypothetical protein
MAAVVAGETIVVTQMHADAGCRGFLAGVEMNEPWNAALGEFDVDAVLEFADGFHRAIRVEQILDGQCLRHECLPLNDGFRPWPLQPVLESAPPAESGGAGESGRLLAPLSVLVASWTRELVKTITTRRAGEPFFSTRAISDVSHIKTRELRWNSVI